MQEVSLMLSIQLTKSIQLTLIALLMTVIAPQALAQERITPVEDCLNRIARVVHNTTHANRHIASRTIEIVEELDADGAEDEAIIAAGREGKEAITERTGAAVTRINTIVDRCVNFLREHDAPPPAIAAVIQGGRDGREAVHASAHRNKTRINHAVAIAIED